MFLDECNCAQCNGDSGDPFVEGENQSFNDRYDEGFEDGYDEGYSNGVDEERESSYQNGWDEGYEEGKEHGCEDKYDEWEADFRSSLIHQINPRLVYKSIPHFTRSDLKWPYCFDSLSQEQKRLIEDVCEVIANEI